MVRERRRVSPCAPAARTDKTAGQPCFFTHVVGSPITHSLSPVIFDAANVGVHCERAEVPRGGLADFLQIHARCDRGESVTMPLKKEAFDVCDWVDPQACAVGSINTLVIEPDSGQGHCDFGKNDDGTYNIQNSATPYIRGYNTDIQGIVEAIRESAQSNMYARSCLDSANTGCEFSDTHINSRALILGSGATASSALAALTRLGVEDITISARRSCGEGTVFEVAEKLAVPVTYIPLSDAASAMSNVHFIIATLPSGVADPIASELAHSGADLSTCSVLDAAYRQYPSMLTQAVVHGGGINIPGYEMLIHQGLEQASLFTGKTPDSATVHAAIKSAIRQRMRA